MLLPGVTCQGFGRCAATPGSLSVRSLADVSNAVPGGAPLLLLLPPPLPLGGCGSWTSRNLQTICCRCANLSARLPALAALPPDAADFAFCHRFQAATPSLHLAFELQRRRVAKGVGGVGGGGGVGSHAGRWETRFGQEQWEADIEA